MATFSKQKKGLSGIYGQLIGEATQLMRHTHNCAACAQTVVMKREEFVCFLRAKRDKEATPPKKTEPSLALKIIQQHKG